MRCHHRLYYEILLSVLLGCLAVAAQAQYYPTGRGPVRRPGIPNRPPTATNQPGTPGATGPNVTGQQTGARGFVPPGIDLVAGVMLDRPAEFPAGLNDVRAAAYDPKEKRLYLIGQSNRKLASFRPDDLAVALRAIDTGFPGVSIEGPIHDGLMTVRYYGDVQDTHFGQVLFEADRLLKSLALGRDNVTKKGLHPNVPGFESELDKLRRMGGARMNGAWHRYWFRPARVALTESEDGRAFRFDDVRIEVRTEYVPRVSDSQSEPAAEEFARHFTEHYDDFAAIYPVFAELKELAKVAALAQWLNENRIPLDSLEMNKAVITPIDTPETTPIGYARVMALLPQGLWKHQMQGGVTLRLEDASPSIDSAGAGNGSTTVAGNFFVRREGKTSALLGGLIRRPSDAVRKWLARFDD